MYQSELTFVNVNQSEIDEANREKLKNEHLDNYVKTKEIITRVYNLQKEIETMKLNLCWEKVKFFKLPYHTIANAYEDYAKIFPNSNDETHECRRETCSLVEMRAGQMLWNALNKEEIVCSGTVSICKLSGKYHVCPLQELCSRSIILPGKEGYLCAVTGKDKSQFISNRPHYDEENLVSYKNLEGIDRADNKIGKNILDWDENLKLPEGEANGGKKRQITLFELGQIEEIELKRIKLLNSRSEIENYADEFTTKLLDKKLQENLSLTTADSQTTKRRARRPGRKNFSAKRSSETIAADAQLYLSYVSENFRKKRIIKQYKEKAKELADKRIKTEQRKLSKRNLQVMEMYLIWTEEYITCLEMYSICRHTEFNPNLTLDAKLQSSLITVIQDMWQKIINSPFINERKDNKPQSLNFQRLCIALIYFISNEGYDYNCNFSQKELVQLAVSEELDVYPRLLNLKVNVVPYVKDLKKFLIPETEFNHLKQTIHGFTSTEKTIWEGIKQLKNCFNSLFVKLKEDTVAKLRGNPDDQRAILWNYYYKCRDICLNL